ncbi:hypothetical protein [Sphingobacterium faecium]
MPQNAVQHGSIEQMISTLEGLSVSQFNQNSWLPSGNRYGVNIIENIKLDSDRETPTTINKTDLKEYTSISSILHCTDGWTFLSRAFTSMINADIPSAIFFIYYSELRALMSLFGTNGISILSNKHFYFDINGDMSLPLKKGTHIIVQEILKEYINNNAKSTLLFKWIKIGSNSLYDWLQATGFATSYIMSDFLNQWGLDINEVGADHDTRNQVSYRPHILNSKTYEFNYESNLKQIIDFWRLCEPEGTSEFKLLDFYILKKSLQMIFNNLPYGEDQSNLDRITNESYFVDFKQYVKNINATLGSPLLESQINNITSFDTPIDTFLDKASQKAYNSTNNQYDIIPMLARALFLLRFATAGVNHNFIEASISKNDIDFWWKDYGTKYGFWNQNEIPENFVDFLWPDIEEVINDIKNMMSDTEEQFNGPKSLEYFYLKDINCLTQVNKIPLWAFGL